LSSLLEILAVLLLPQIKKKNWKRGIHLEINVGSSKYEFKSLTVALMTHERQLFDKRLWWFVTSMIFVRC
jgi:hypothetical protein